MKPGTLRHAVAAASATAMAGAALVVGGSGVASAEPVSATAETTSGWGSNMKVTRTVSEGVVTYGETVTVSNRLERLGAVNWNLTYWMRDSTPDCFQLVDRAANSDAVTWTPSNGTTYTNGSHPGEVSVSDTVVEVNPPGANSHEPPITMTSRYVVLCDAGQVPSGGFQFNGTVRSGNFPSVGPSINVQRKGTSMLLHEPSSPQVGQVVDIRVVTASIPDGSQVTFAVDGQTIGSDTVDGGTATVQWTPDAEGSTEISANFAQTGTHGASSQTRTVTVSPTNEDSQVAVAASGSPKVGESTDLVATVTPAGAGGTVVFRVNNSVVGQSPVQANGTAITDWIPQSAGQHTIDADFSGRTGVNPSTGGASVTVAEADPGAEATTTTLDSLSTTPAGEEIALRAEVAPSNATGTVSFYDGQTLIGNADVNDGVATLQWTPDESGPYTIRARFTSEEDFLSSQDAKQVTITPGIVDPDPDPDPTEPTDPGTGSLGSLTGSGDGEEANGSLGSLSDFSS